MMKSTKMRKFFTVVTILIISVAHSNFAQELKQLTLRDAVLEQRNALGPDNVKGLQWLDADRYMYIAEVDGKEQLKTFSMKENAKALLFTLDDLNLKLKDKGVVLKSMPGFKVCGNQLIFNTEKGYHLMHLKDQSIESFNNPLEGASDFEFSEDGRKLAYVKENNVHLKSVEEDAVIITKDGTPDLIYGKAVSRFEFGITKGLFWSPDGKALAYYRNDASEVTSYPLTNFNKLPAENTPIKYPMAGGKSEKVGLEVYHLDSKKTISLETGVGEESICSVNWTPIGNARRLERDGAVTVMVNA